MYYLMLKIAGKWQVQHKDDSLFKLAANCWHTHNESDIEDQRVLRVIKGGK